ncbi:uncharacterized protein [Zea mays]|uniref:uncharacterized protein n=1 Tax=Zea mays TaxID=4577 RepID=UPI0004DEB705|nr:uncharacterized protein LOC111590822 [Zea mays]|eukprot:XP_023157371.1 uncharacterized protein LOC111590822 [Zea mays]
MTLMLDGASDFPSRLSHRHMPVVATIRLDGFSSHPSHGRMHIPSHKVPLCIAPPHAAATLNGSIAPAQCPSSTRPGQACRLAGNRPATRLPPPALPSRSNALARPDLQASYRRAIVQGITFITVHQSIWILYWMMLLRICLLLWKRLIVPPPLSILV